MVKVMDHEAVVQIWKDETGNHYIFCNNEGTGNENIDYTLNGNDIDNNDVIVTDEMLTPMSVTRDQPTSVTSENNAIRPNVSPLANFFNSVHLCDGDSECSSLSSRNCFTMSHRNDNFLNTPTNENQPFSPGGLVQSEETTSFDQVSYNNNQSTPSSAVLNPLNHNEVLNTQPATDYSNVASTSTRKSFASSSTNKVIRHRSCKMYLSNKSKRKHKIFVLPDQNTGPPGYLVKINFKELGGNNRQRSESEIICSWYGKKDSNEDGVYRKTVGLLKDIQNNFLRNPKSINISMNHHMFNKSDDSSDDENMYEQNFM